MKNFLLISVLLAVITMFTGCGPVVEIKQSNGKVIDGYTRK